MSLIRWEIAMSLRRDSGAEGHFRYHRVSDRSAWRCEPASWPDFVLIVKRELIVRPRRVDQEAVGARLALHLPTRSFQRGQDTPCFSGWPVAHREWRRKRRVRRMPFHRAQSGRQ